MLHQIFASSLYNKNLILDYSWPFSRRGPRTWSPVAVSKMSSILRSGIPFPRGRGERERATVVLPYHRWWLKWTIVNWLLMRRGIKKYRSHLDHSHFLAPQPVCLFSQSVIKSYHLLVLFSFHLVGLWDFLGFTFPPHPPPPLFPDGMSVHCRLPPSISSGFLDSSIHIYSWVERTLWK